MYGFEEGGNFGEEATGEKPGTNIPHLVKPLDLEKQSLPTDAYIEPNDFELFLLGILEGRKKRKSSGTNPPITYLDKRGGLEGKFGHTIP